MSVVSDKSDGFFDLSFHFFFIFVKFFFSLICVSKKIRVRSETES